MSDTELYETVTSSIIKRTRQQKLATLAANFAIRIAKDRNDPLYRKYQRFRKLFWDSKKLLIKRYGSRGMVIARKSMQKSQK